MQVLRASRQEPGFLSMTAAWVCAGVQALTVTRGAVEAPGVLCCDAAAQLRGIEGEREARVAGVAPDLGCCCCTMLVLVPVFAAGCCSGRSRRDRR